MKKPVIFLALFIILGFSLAGQIGRAPKARANKDTSVSKKAVKKDGVVKGRKARMRLQLRQIRQHKKQLHEIDSVQKELGRELHKNDQPQR